MGWNASFRIDDKESEFQNEYQFPAHHNWITWYTEKQFRLKEGRPPWKSHHQTLWCRPLLHTANCCIILFPDMQIKHYFCTGNRWYLTSLNQRYKKEANFSIPSFSKFLVYYFSCWSMVVMSFGHLKWKHCFPQNCINFPWKVKAVVKVIILLPFLKSNFLGCFPTKLDKKIVCAKIFLRHIITSLQVSTNINWEIAEKSGFGLKDGL